MKINRAPAFGGYYVAVVPPQVSHDLQNDPDWIDSANAGEPDRRFRGELRTYAGVKFVEHTNPYLEDGTGAEGTYAVATARLGPHLPDLRARPGRVRGPVDRGRVRRTTRGSSSSTARTRPTR